MSFQLASNSRVSSTPLKEALQSRDNPLIKTSFTNKCDKLLRLVDDPFFLTNTFSTSRNTTSAQKDNHLNFSSLRPFSVGSEVSNKPVVDKTKMEFLTDNKLSISTTRDNKITNNNNLSKNLLTEYYTSQLLSNNKKTNLNSYKVTTCPTVSSDNMKSSLEFKNKTRELRNMWMKKKFTVSTIVTHMKNKNNDRKSKVRELASDIKEPTSQKHKCSRNTVINKMQTTFPMYMSMKNQGNSFFGNNMEKNNFNLTKINNLKAHWDRSKK